MLGGGESPGAGSPNLCPRPAQRAPDRRRRWLAPRRQWEGRKLATDYGGRVDLILRESKQGVGEGSGLRRQILSSFGNPGIRLVTGLKARDATSGFKAFRASSLRSIQLTQLRCRGSAFQADLSHRCQPMGCRTVEHLSRFVSGPAAVHRCRWVSRWRQFGGG